jgi:prophage regulatory protein
MDTKNLPAALRVKQIVKPHGILPFSAAHWWAGVKSKRYPQPIIQSGRMTMWRTEDVLAILEGKQ